MEFSDDIKSLCLDVFMCPDTDIGLNELSKDELLKLREEVLLHIDYDYLMDRSMKLLGNSMYGGSGNKHFYFFDPNLAADITAEGRALTQNAEECLDEFFTNEWYDRDDVHSMLGIEVKKEMKGKYTEHVVYCDTDSAYTCYSHILDSLVVPLQTDDEKLQFIIDLNMKFLNGWNTEQSTKFVNDRNGCSNHNFELETIARSSIHLAKKMYIQAIVWKDGKTYKEPQIKPKGIEIVRSSTPGFCRKYLKEMSALLLLEDVNTVQYKFHQELNRLKSLFMISDIEEISSSVNVGDYNKYVISDSDILEFVSAPPISVQAAARYNYALYHSSVKDKYAPIKSGKIKYYTIKPAQRPKSTDKKLVFGYPAGDYPNEFAPEIDRPAQFKKTFIDPINRIATVMGLPEFNGDGSVQSSLF